MQYLREELIRFRHCDPAGIVFYPRYLEIVNDTVEDWFDEMGFSFQEMHERYDAGVPTVNINVRFTSPCRQGERLRLALHCTRVGDSSLEVAISASRTGVPVFDAQVVLCFSSIGAKVGKLSIPPEIRQQVVKYLAAETALQA